MQFWLKALWITVTICSTASLVWFLLGSTANFQRGLDLIRSVILVKVWLPALALTLLSIMLIMKGWIPTNKRDFVRFFCCLILLILLSIVLIQSVGVYGWIKESVTSDSIKITQDGLYEYRIELINLFQRNSYARLYIKKIDTGEEMKIPIDIQTQKIGALSINLVNNWVMLEPTDKQSHYILHTTNDLRIPEERFEIDIQAGTSRRIN